jgi:hypothetical protein
MTTRFATGPFQCFNRTRGSSGLAVVFPSASPWYSLRPRSGPGWYIKVSARAHNVPPVSHIFRSLSITQLDGILDRDEDFGVSPTTPLEGNGICVRRAVVMPHEIVPPGAHPSLWQNPCTKALTQALDTLFWDAIFSMDVTSAEGLSNISTLVHSPSKITAARSLQGDKAQTFIDLMDRVSDLGKRPLDRML